MAQKTALDKNLLEKIRKYRLLIERAGIKVKEIYVFGSQVKGKAKPWSDIDIGVVSPKAEHCGVATAGSQ